MYTEKFLEFWNNYPRRIAKISAFNSWVKAIKKFGATEQQMIDGAKRYSSHVSGKDIQYIKHPSTWLNGGCWEDEYEQDTKKDRYMTSNERRIDMFKKTGFWPQDWGERPLTH